MTEDRARSARSDSFTNRCSHSGVSAKRNISATSFAERASSSITCLWSMTARAIRRRSERAKLALKSLFTSQNRGKGEAHQDRITLLVRSTIAHVSVSSIPMANIFQKRSTGSLAAAASATAAARFSSAIA